MSKNISRRKLITGAGVVAAGAAVSEAIGAKSGQAGSETIKVIGVSCSPRAGKTTSQAIAIALKAVEEAAPIVETELIDLGGMSIGGWAGGAKPGQGKTPEDDFEKILPKLQDPAVAGLIIGSPVFFRSMSSLCKAFLERCAVLRKPKYMLSDKPVGVLSVGAYRNGGQELVIEQIQAAMLCQDVFIVGGKPSAHQGATLWNVGAGDDITKDEFGVNTAKLLGARIGHAVMKVTGYDDIK